MKILISRHIDIEGPGYLADFLARRGIDYDMVRVDSGDAYPPSIADYAGLVFMGGPMSVNDPLPWISEAQRLIREAVTAGRPVLGHCLGGQLLAKALGAPVTRNPFKEIGWLPVQRVDNPVASEWLAGLPAEFPVFHWHGETFALPAGATRILASRACANQGFVIGNSLGLQCHVEMTAPMVADWARAGASELEPSATVQSAEEMLRDIESRIATLHTAADALYTRWLKGLARP